MNKTFYKGQKVIVYEKDEGIGKKTIKVGKVWRVSKNGEIIIKFFNQYKARRRRESKSFSC